MISVKDAAEDADEDIRKRLRTLLRISRTLLKKSQTISRTNDLYKGERKLPFFFLGFSQKIQKPAEVSVV